MKKIEIIVPAFSEVTFQIAVTPVISSDVNTEVQGSYKRIKISKGEESNFIWSIIYTLLDQIVEILNESDETNRMTDNFDQLEYVFIDDPVTSLDENHLIELAVDLAHLIKSSTSDLKFIITTHSPLFYNVLYNELNNKYYKHKGTENQEVTFKQNQAVKYRLSKNEDESFQLDEIDHDSPFSYHLYLLSELQKAISSTQIKKYHFNFLRNILEKTSTFLGYERWQELLEKTKDGNPDPFADRIINISSHSKHSGDEVSELVEKDKKELIKLVNYLIKKHSFWQKKEQNV